MTSDSPELRFSTQAHGNPVAALVYLNDRNQVLPLEPLRKHGLHAEIVVHGPPRLRVMSATFVGVAQRSPPEREMRVASDDLFFGRTLSGASRARQRGCDIELADGDAVLLARGEDGFSLTHAARVRFLGVRLPRAALSGLVPDLDAAITRRVPRNHAVLELLTAYLRAAGTESLEHPLIKGHVHDLVALALGAARNAEATLERRSVPAARLVALQADIAAQLSDPALSIAVLASRHRVTPRYVHKLFERSGSTFSEFVLRSRLERAHRRLRDPAWDDHSISAIAFDVGFGDLSYFNRSFRRLYGATPSEIRRTRR